MRIHYLSWSEVPSRQANSVHVMKMCQAFAKQGHNVTLFAIRPRDKNQLGIDPYDYFGIKRIFDIEIVRKIPIKKIGRLKYVYNTFQRVNKRSLPDIFFGRDPYCLLRVGGTGVPIIYEAHSSPRGIQRLIENWLFKQKSFYQLIVISEALRKYYINYCPHITSDKILVAHDGADPPSRETPAPIDNWPGNPEELQVGYTGHLYAGRGIDLIIALAQKLPNVSFHIIGGTEKDINRWKQICRANKVYFHGYIPHGRLGYYLYKFDIMLAPYQANVKDAGGIDTSQWMSPLKIFEYMAYSKAIICSDLNALREILTDRVNALLVPPNCLEAWEQAVKELEGDIKLRKDLGKRAKDNFLRNYTWDRRAAKVLSNFLTTSTCNSKSQGIK